MNTVVLAAGFGIALFAAFCLTPLIARLARYNKWVDLPGGERTVHKEPTPRAGGIAVIITFLLGTGYMLLMGPGFDLPLGATTHLLSWAMMLGAAAIALTGLYDDAYGLGFKKKFLFQLLVAYGMYLAGYRIDVPEIYFLEADPYMQAGLGLPLTLLWYLGVMNAVNLIDGLDGLAAGISTISFVCLAIIFGLQGQQSLIPIAIIMGGALLGFLYYNFNPASIFLGDTGSLFLGFIIATYALQGTAHPQPFVALIIMALAVGYPLLDTALAFVRRFLKGHSPFAPDKDHIHHRMTGRFKYSTRKTVVALYVIHGLFCAAAITLSIVATSYSLLIITGVVAGICLFLKGLGYLKLQRGMTLIRRRISDQIGERVPRGQWSGDGSVRPILEPIATTNKSIRPEKEEEREFVVHSLE